MVKKVINNILLVVLITSVSCRAFCNTSVKELPHPVSSKSIKMCALGGFTLGLTVAPLAYLLAPNPRDNKKINAGVFGGIAAITGGLLTFFYYRAKEREFLSQSQNYYQDQMAESFNKYLFQNQKKFFKGKK